MDPAAIMAYIQAAQVLIAAGVMLGSQLHDVAVKLAQMFHGKPLTEEEINLIIVAAKAKAQDIEAQAAKDKAQADADEAAGR